MAPPTKTSMMLVTGEYFDPFAPDPSVINLDVLAHGLDVPRFNSQTLRPISIAEHSLRVRRIARELARVPALVATTRRDHLRSVELWALLHDAHEALVPWGDCLRPGKDDQMRDVESRVDDAICRALRIKESVSVWDIVKTADAIALYFEAMLWQPGARDWAPEIMIRVWEEIRVPGSATFRGAVIDRFMPLIAPRPCECWRDEVESLLGVRS